jgi:hypothetical protein
MPDRYGVSDDAILVFNSLMATTPIAIDPVDLSADVYKIPSDTTSAAYAEIKKLTNADLTSGATDGTGVFDVLMQGVRAQILKEYESGRITQAEYTKAYTAMMEAAMQNAVQFLIQRDAAYWQAVNAQAAMVTARVQNEIAKYNAVTARLGAETAKANLALSKVKLGTEDAQYGTAKYQLENVLPQQVALSKSQMDVAAVQKALILEQTEVQRSQTLDARSDGQTVSGTVGAQKKLYAQQIISYQRDSEVKAGKIFSDAWITMRTSDDGLAAPAGFTNDSINQVLSALKANNGLGT